MQPRESSTCKTRNGKSVVETIVALFVLGVLIAAVGQFSNHIRTGLADRRLSQAIQWELENARELIGTWSIEQITSDKIAQLPISQTLSEQLTTPRWLATVESIAIAPQQQGTTADSMVLKGVNVSLRLEAEYRGQTIKPAELVFWIFDSTSTASSTSESSTGAPSASTTSSSLSPVAVTSNNSTEAQQ